MAIELRDFGGAIYAKDTTNGNDYTFSKKTAEIDVVTSGSNAAIAISDGRNAISFPFSDVTLPTGFADIDALYTELQTWLRRAVPSFGYAKYWRSGTNLNPAGMTPERFIIVDLSDTTNYPHEYTNRIEIQHIKIVARETALPAPGTVILSFKTGFLSDVDRTDGTLETITKSNFTLGNAEMGEQDYYFNENPIVCDSSRYVTFDEDENEAAWADTQTYRSTLDSTSADTNPGSGDLVGQVTFWDAGTAEIEILVGYNTY